MKNEHSKTEQPCTIQNVSDIVEYIQLLSTGTKAYWDERCKHFVSENRRFHVNIDRAKERSDMYIHYR